MESSGTHLWWDSCHSICCANLQILYKRPCGVHLLLYTPLREKSTGVKSTGLGDYAVGPPLQVYFPRKILSRNFHMIIAEPHGAPSYCNVTCRITSLVCRTMYNSSILREQVLAVVSYEKKVQWLCCVTHIETVNKSTETEKLMTEVTHKFNFLIQPEKWLRQFIHLNKETREPWVSNFEFIIYFKVFDHYILRFSAKLHFPPFSFHISMGTHSTLQDTGNS